MGIEDIPLMQLIMKNGRPFELSDDRTYASKFVQIIHEPSATTYIYTNADWNSHQGVFNYFCARLTQIHGISADEENNFKAKGGGGMLISLDGQLILFEGVSRRFGKYNKELVQPVAERFRDQYFPNAKIEFK